VTEPRMEGNGQAANRDGDTPCLKSYFDGSTSGGSEDLEAYLAKQ
jgi:hypothetical protein